MTRELFWLTLTVILTGILWVPYIINRSQVRGLSGAMANPSRNDKPHAEWATRLMFAHDNAIENLVIFAPLVLILNAIDYSSKWTVLACAVYFWARVAHVIVYTLGLPVFRTLAFTVGFLAQAVLALAIFKVLSSRVPDAQSASRDTRPLRIWKHGPRLCSASPKKCCAASGARVMIKLEV
jgi:uncharacterized MAPEG superfamily protein